jgi:hypothetical protein
VEIVSFVNDAGKKLKKLCWLNINVIVEIFCFGEGDWGQFAKSVKSSIIVSGFVFFVKKCIV